MGWLGDTNQLSGMAWLGGRAIGICGAAERRVRATCDSRIWGGYVEIVRQTPFVVQVFFVVFGLPVTRERWWRVVLSPSALWGEG